MKRRILFNMLCAVIGTAVVFTLLVLLVLTDFFTGQIGRELEQNVRQVGVALLREEDPQGYLQALADAGFAERLTLIDEDGTVLFDSQSDHTQMENHLGRTEILIAEQEGVGTSMRYSPTQEELTYYCALELENGGFLRISDTHRSLYSALHTLSVLLVAALVVVGTAAVFLATHLTKKIVQPINEMDLNTPENNEIYPELQPLVERMAEQNRREFTANVTHELKTPLTSIVGYAEIMKQRVAPEKDWPLLVEYIYTEGSRMIRLVEDILLLSRLDSGVQHGNSEILDMMPAAEEIALRFQHAAQARGVHIQLKLESARLSATRQTLDEILSNLIDNAIKYNREGGSVTVETFETESGSLLIVRDTGIGITAEDQHRVFERFFRADKSRSKATGGTGLGLSIVKHAVQLLGGTIRLRSMPGEGTEITIRFPLKG